ncbi:hypothetical protein MCOR29_008951 [Pyricularia oryzae]|uniref:MINDY deubiquitinase domain-containing protein n=1 Tax=Pyricularia grisea TaxID=148305 RepID=A0ABQ8NK65_PYRGI|nr:hypothetical protein MCOR33_005929 [Pyricularia grisea]KAI6309351.1 hypothetical protein MCOR29_008951 [Pyricularia oryzae]KAI6445619.1 hypothetical protein MCOR22_004228 [Pyricularia oryzae]KAI6531784.1 hypothetical protein MCOR05_007250 [Pyricularia oryzae]KAI6572346.1 hypothetical protein MCOR09_003499 [Pyricularia oryzae]
MVTRKALPDDARLDNSASGSRPSTSLQDDHSQLDGWAREDWRTDPNDINGRIPIHAHQRHGSSPDPALANVPNVLRPGAAPSTPGSSFSNQEGPEENVWKDESPRLLPQQVTGNNNGGHQPGIGGTSPATMSFPSDVPEALRPGGAGVTKHNTNPFKRKPTPGSAASANHIVPSVTLTSPTPPSAPFSQLSITPSDGSNNPWRPALDEKNNIIEKRKEPLAFSSADDRELGRDIWSAAADNSQDHHPTSAKATASPNDSPGSPALISFSTEEEGASAWGEATRPPPPTKAVPSAGGADDELAEGSHAWDDLGTRNKGKGPVIPNMAANASQTSEWNLIDSDPSPGDLSRRSTWENFDDAPEAATGTGPVSRAPTTDAHEAGSTDQAGSGAAMSSDPGPPLPPRTSREGQAPQRATGSGAVKNETYQIKNINWYDANAAKNPRTSPILVQNANGPCPLLALVNALSLTTPADSQTALTDTLRSREQISLTFLLDAVFDELMSPRRLSEDAALPDVTELYDFLKGLHTGMNVNPRFLPTDEVINAFKRTSLTHVHPSQRSDNMVPGTFEDTKEMRLYSIFAIPLIHGWIPSQDDEAYAAFKRHAASYEDAQNLLFREEELEDRLTNSDRGLTEEEQGLYQDIFTIKGFLDSSATQLTRYGLEVITEAMKPGSVAILFRNDHFSTLYRHPQTLEILTLVTDAGYAGHAEVVWESLVDTTGERAEFFSGDFRVVGGAGENQYKTQSGSQKHSSASGSISDAAGSWQTARGRRGNRSGSGGEGSSSSAPQQVPSSPMAEQEDRDLALAMQLQEEEDERHREEQQRRQRESLLSEQYIEQQAQGRHQGGANTSSAASNGGRRRTSSGAVSVPVTGTAARPAPINQVVRSLVPAPVVSRPRVNRPVDENATEEAPPTYEQASKQEAYIPPEGHPSHPASSPVAPGSPSASTTTAAAAAPVTGIRPPGMRPDARVAPGSYPQSNSSASSAGRGGPHRYGVPAVGVPTGLPPRERDCVVM